MRLDASASRSLGEFPHAVDVIDCEGCGRAGSYRRGGLLLEPFGAAALNLEGAGVFHITEKARSVREFAEDWRSGRLHLPK